MPSNQVPPGWRDHLILGLIIVILLQDAVMLGHKEQFWFGLFFLLLTAAFVIRFNAVTEAWLKGLDTTEPIQTAAPAQQPALPTQTQPQPVPPSGDPARRSVMARPNILLRALGGLGSIVGNILWIFTIIALLIAAFMPAAKTINVPLYGSTIYETILELMVPFLIVLVIANGIDGRWGPVGMRRWSIWTSRLAAYVMTLVLIGVIVAMFYSANPVEKLVFWAVFGVTVFAWYDNLVQQGEQWRATSLTDPKMARRAAKLHGTPVEPAVEEDAGLGPFYSFVRTLGPGSRIDLPNNTPYVTLDAAGYIDVDTEIGEPELLAVMTNEVQRRLTARP